ncbi:MULTISPECIES: peptidoglycan editing factor PgeF [Acidobacterium]|uniref:peptidoglycan editing factor PgeF n=1 Tax=Acidobacterium TaxID=33973 RepID=UPI00030E364F|nr:MULTISPECIES: peptidoglycan editing factor PgeF [Acidobacterium]HCT60968.1 peptidoglycan editing factor PgeF [Acidobacterium sp.]
MPSPSTKPARLSPSSPAAIQAIDDLLASVGLEHGRRKLGRDGIIRQAKYAPARELHADDLRQPQRPVRPRQVEVVQAPGWANHPWLMHGFSTRSGGVTKIYRAAREGQEPGKFRGAGELNLGFTQSDERALVEENRHRFVQAVAGNSALPLVTLQQIHSQITYRIGKDDELAAVRRGDGLMTRRPGILLGIQTADCISVMVADTKRQAVAIFHAGWRGTLRRIVQGGVGRMRMEFGSKPKDLIAAIGPGIGQCCYAVGEEVRTEFRSQFAYSDELFCEVYDSDPVREKYPLLFLTARAPGHSPIGPSLHLDLFEANRRQLLDAGLREDSISVLGDCTSCHTNRYFSHRAERGFTGRMMAVIGIRE